MEYTGYTHRLKRHRASRPFPGVALLLPDQLFQATQKYTLQALRLRSDKLQSLGMLLSRVSWSTSSCLLRSPPDNCRCCFEERAKSKTGQSPFCSYALAARIVECLFHSLAKSAFLLFHDPAATRLRVRGGYEARPELRACSQPRFEPISVADICQRFNATPES